MRVIICVILVIILLVGGCTVNFKGKDVEMDGTIVHQYELDSIYCFRPQSPSPGRSELAWTESPTHNP